MSPPKSPLNHVQECKSAHDRLIANIVALDDDQIAQPSRLPDWTRAHVLSHLASNAESVLRRLSAAREGRIVDQDLGGAEGRRGEIERGSLRPAGELVDLVCRTSKGVDELFAAFQRTRGNNRFVQWTVRIALLALLCSRVGEKSRRIMLTSTSGTRSSIGLTRS